MKKLLTIILSLILLILPLAACGEKNDGKIKIRLNEVTHSIFYTPQYLALSLGYFDEEGLEIDLINGGGADVSMNAILSGAADIGFMGPRPRFTSTRRKKGLPHNIRPAHQEGRLLSRGKAVRRQFRLLQAAGQRDNRRQKRRHARYDAGIRVQSARPL